MHNLHYLLVNADTAAGAADGAEAQISHWGDENNWRRIGGVASEDGSDDIANHQDARWGLSWLDADAGMPRAGTYFRRAAAHLLRAIAGPVDLPATPFTVHPDPAAARAALADQLRDFDLDRGDLHELWCIRRNLEHLSSLLEARRAVARGEEIPEFYPWQLDEFGLTDLTGQSEGARRYLVFLDMHS